MLSTSFPASSNGPRRKATCLFFGMLSSWCSIKSCRTLAVLVLLKRCGLSASKPPIATANPAQLYFFWCEILLSQIR